jgi:enoyl-CoA hydratase
MAMVSEERRGPVHIVTLNRSERRNAVDPPTAAALREAFGGFEADERARVLVLTGAGRHFCAGADLAAVASGDFRHDPSSHGPLGPTRLEMTKPTIAAVEGYAVAGGLELALLCDLRVASETAIFGVFCRRWGVPLIDGGSIRLPRLIGQSRALDMILTGRPVDAAEALSFGLANRVVPAGRALEASIELAEEIAGFPQNCVASDRRSVLEQWSLDLAEALRHEAELGQRSLLLDGRAGAKRFIEGARRPERS